MINHISENPHFMFSMVLQVERSPNTETLIANSFGSVWGHPKPSETIKKIDDLLTKCNFLETCPGSGVLCRPLPSECGTVYVIFWRASEPSDP